MLQELQKLKLIWDPWKMYQASHLRSSTPDLTQLLAAGSFMFCSCDSFMWMLVSWRKLERFMGDSPKRQFEHVEFTDFNRLEGKIVFFDPLLCGRSPRFYAGQKEMNNFSLGSFCWHSLLACKMRSWYPKQPYFYGCFNWIVPNLYLGNGCFSISIH